MMPCLDLSSVVLFGQQARGWHEGLFDLLRRPDFVVFLIPISAIFIGGIIAITKIMITHRERIAMIERGIHPDYPPEEEDEAAAQPPETMYGRTDRPRATT